jgi:hypothetical protein
MWTWQGIPRLGHLGVQLGGGDATANRLHVGNEVDQVLNSRLVLLQAHSVCAGEGKAQGELRLDQPAV